MMATHIEDMDGVPWHQAPRPRRRHRCTAQTRALTSRMRYVERCACGAIRIDRAVWLERNSRRHQVGRRATGRRLRRNARAWFGVGVIVLGLSLAAAVLAPPHEHLRTVHLEYRWQHPTTIPAGSAPAPADQPALNVGP